MVGHRVKPMLESANYTWDCIFLSAARVYVHTSFADLMSQQLSTTSIIDTGFVNNIDDNLVNKDICVSSVCYTVQMA